MNLRLPVVCGKCNNEWMSQLETAVKPIVLPLLVGAPSVLDAEMQSTLARWILMKMMLVEQIFPTSVSFSDDQREKFLTKLEMPFQLQLWLGKTNAVNKDDEWFARAIRHSTSAVLHPDPSPTITSVKNIQTLAFGTGGLFIFGIFSLYGRVPLELFFRIGRPLVQLWPVTSANLIWPPQDILSDKIADTIANLLITRIENPYFGTGPTK
jgi:hypothetical protein